MRQLSSASAQAKARHVSIDIASLTTETTKVTANPNGTFTMTNNPLPVRVKVHGKWRPVSPALRRGPGGTWTTTATPSRLTLSGGGTGPMAILTSTVGGRIALTFPGRLPAPAVHGATASYHNALPGITLRLTATSLGGLTETLIAANSKAAASPRFRQLRLALATTGLRLRRTQAGTMQATGPHGVAEFSTATAVAVTAHTLTVAAPARVASAFASYPTYVSTSITPDSVSGCGNQASCYGEKSGSTGYTEVKAGCDTYAGWNNNDQYGNGIGNQDYGGGCGGAYRAYYQIDTSGLVALGSFGTVHVEGAVFSADENYGSDHNCKDPWSASLHLTDVIDSNTDWKNKPANNSGDQPRNQRPTPGPNPNSTCTKQLVQFTVAYAMIFAVNNGWKITTFGLQGDEAASADPDPATGAPTDACAGGESTGGLSAAGYNCGFMRIGDNPNVTTTFDITPPTPFCNNTNSTTQNGSASSCDTQLIPTPQDSPGATDFGCGSATGWINQTSVKFNVAAQAAITGEDVSVTDNVWDNTDNGATVSQVTSGYVPTSGSANITAGTATALSGLLNGHQYGWDAAANVDGSEPGTNNGSDGSNGPYASGKSGHCRFNIDTAAPTNLSVSSSQFPSSTSGQSGQDAGTSGNFTFSATDPVPTGCITQCVASGVYHFTYSLNGGTPASVNPAAATTPGAAQTYTVPLTIGNWGTNVLSVTATDVASNVTSTPFVYTFYAPFNPSTPVTSGDVDGDGIPDLLGTTSTNLILYPGDTNPAASVQSGSGCGSPASVYNGPCIAAPQSGSPNGTAWNNFLIAHRGTMSEENVDDLFAYNKTNNEMYIINNNPSAIGAAPQLSAGNTSSMHTIPDHPVCAATADNASNCTGYPGGTANPNTSNWAGVQQIIAPGDAWSGAASDTGLASLITVENGTLWLYQGAFGGALSGATFAGATGPIQLGSSAGTTNWSGMTLIAPGDVNGQLTLWALNNATGAIYSYPITIDQASGQPTINPAGTGTPVTATSGPIVATIPTSNNYVAFASPGPLDTAFPGLYAETTTGTSPSGTSCANGCLWFYPGESITGGASPLNTKRMYVGTLSTPVSQLS